VNRRYRIGPADTRPIGARGRGVGPGAWPRRVWAGDAWPVQARRCDPRPGDLRRQAGSVTLLALGFAVFVLLAGLVAVDVGLLVVARARAQTAADLAALASLTPPGAGADAARVVAAGNGAELAACACGPAEAVVTVRTRVRMLPGRIGVSVTARARAVLPVPTPTGQARSRPGQSADAMAAGHRPAVAHEPSPGRVRILNERDPVGVPLVTWPGPSPGGIGTTRPSGAGCGASATWEAPRVGPGASAPVCILRGIY
jgi:secretion/DNA translocation related TadE-like protein